MEKGIILTAVIAIMSIMASCTSESDFDDVRQEMEEETTEATVTRSNVGNISNDSACIRIKIYETVQGYNVILNNVRINNLEGNNIPFGNNIEGTMLGTKAYDATYDRENREYTLAEAGTRIKLNITFNAKLISEDGSDVMNLKNITVSLNDEAIFLYAGVANEITLKITAKTLGLQAISFGANVQECNDVSINE